MQHRGEADERVSVLLLSEGDAGLAALVSQCLAFDGGFDVHCLNHSRSDALRSSRHTTVTRAPLSTPQDILSATRAYAARHPIDVIVPLQESVIVRVGLVESELAELAAIVPHPDPELCRLVDDKWQFSAKGRELGLPFPMAVSCTDHDWEERVLEIKGPVVLKPLVGFGGGGMRRFDSAAALLDAHRTGDIAWGESAGRWMVEEFVGGTDAGSSLLAIDGEVLGLSIKRTLVGQAYPFQSAGMINEYISHPEIEAISRAFVRAFDWSGPANLDFRVRNDGAVFLLEVNPRFWASMLGELSRGMNFPSAACRLALGEKQTMPEGAEITWFNLALAASTFGNLWLLRSHARLVCSSLDRRIIRIDPMFEMAHVREQYWRRCKRRVVAVRRSLVRTGRKRRIG